MCGKLSNFENQLVEQIIKKYKSDWKSVSFAKENKKELKEYKKCVYAFYENEYPIYIGMVSDAKTASVYARIYSNGNAAHCHKPWFKKKTLALYVYVLNTDDIFDVIVLERVLIKELKPKMNDLIYNIKDLQCLFSKME